MEVLLTMLGVAQLSLMVAQLGDFGFGDFMKAIFSGAGVAGLILGFHLWKLAPELRAIWRANDRRTRMETLRLIASVHVSPAIKDEAANLISEIESEEKAGQRRSLVPP